MDEVTFGLHREEGFTSESEGVTSAAAQSGNVSGSPLWWEAMSGGAGGHVLRWEAQKGWV